MRDDVVRASGIDETRDLISRSAQTHILCDLRTTNANTKVREVVTFAGDKPESVRSWVRASERRTGMLKE